MFSFPLLQGNPQTALQGKGKVVITESLANTFFGSESPMNQEIEIYVNDEYRSFTISGIMKDPPNHSTLDFKLLMPLANEGMATFGMGGLRRTAWSIGLFQVFLSLSPDVDLPALHRKMPEFAARYYKSEDFEEFYGKGNYQSFQFQPFKEVHFDQIISSELHPPGRPKYAYILAGIGLAVMLIAGINFVILAIARSSVRTKEIGLRKVIGARKKQLIYQFIGEFLLYSGMALMVGLLLAYLFLPEFNRLANEELDFTQLTRWQSFAFLLGITLLLGLLAGIYPALFMAAYSPVNSLKNKYRIGQVNVFTKFLISTQFILSVVLVILTLIMADQLNYMKNKDLGFDQECLLAIHNQDADKTQFFSRFKNELSDDPQITSLSSVYPPFTYRNYSNFFKFKGREIRYTFQLVGHNYLETMGIDLLKGRNFNPSMAQDSSQNIIINEAFAKEMGWEDPIGKTVEGLRNAGYRNPRVIGVTNNFNFQSLAEPVRPLWIGLGPDYYMSALMVRIRPEGVQSTIRKLERIWKDLQPDLPFHYSFVDEDMDALYKEQERWGNIVKTASILAVIIAFIGLFGLVSLSVTGRAKEMSIRKIFGAAPRDIALALSRQFSILMGIALIIASPVAWYLANEWLKNFAFRVHIKAELFIFAFSLIMLAFFLILLYHIIRIVRQNPVDYLRVE